MVGPVTWTLVGFVVEWGSWRGIGDWDVVSSVRYPVTVVGEGVREGCVEVVGFVPIHPIFKLSYPIGFDSVVWVVVLG